MIVKIEDHDTWIKERMNGIGGSESGSVVLKRAALAVQNGNRGSA